MTRNGGKTGRTTSQNRRNLKQTEPEEHDFRGNAILVAEPRLECGWGVLYHTVLFDFPAAPSATAEITNTVKHNENSYS